MPHLSVTLAADPRGLRVTWRLHGVTLATGDVLGRLPLSVAGAPTLDLADDAPAAQDDRGPLPLRVDTAEAEDGEDERRWTVGRATSGPVEMSYVAEPVGGEPRPATPPLELRREGGGLSGALKTFVVLPPGPGDLGFELRWDGSGGGDGWTAVSSLGEADEPAAGAGLERLGDTYVMCGDLTRLHRRDGLSVWWLTDPGIDVEAFAARLGTTYALMAETFDSPVHPYRVFLRTHPHRGLNGSAHPASFVLGLNPAAPLDPSAIYETLAHEVVHEWLHLDGATEDVTWFSEGAADYYSLVVPFRAGLITAAELLRAVNDEARECYANPRRGLGVREAQALFFSDFWAHRLPYTRGLFYLADLDARLREATSGRQGVDDVVRAVVRRRRAGERVGLDGWCARVEELSGAPELPVLDAMVLTGAGRPRPGCFGPGFEQDVVQVPVLDVGVDPSTLLTGRVRGLVPGGAADRAGLREGESLDLPRYPELLRLQQGDVLEVGVVRHGTPARVTVPLEGTAPVPQWRAVSPPPSSPAP